MGEHILYNLCLMLCGCWLWLSLRGMLLPHSKPEILTMIKCPLADFTLHKTCFYVRASYPGSARNPPVEVILTQVETPKILCSEKSNPFSCPVPCQNSGIMNIIPCVLFIITMVFFFTVFKHHDRMGEKVNLWASSIPLCPISATHFWAATHDLKTTVQNDGLQGSTYISHILTTLQNLNSELKSNRTDC